MLGIAMILASMSLLVNKQEFMVSAEDKTGGIYGIDDYFVSIYPTVYLYKRDGEKIDLVGFGSLEKSDFFDADFYRFIWRDDQQILDDPNKEKEDEGFGE